ILTYNVILERGSRVSAEAQQRILHRSQTRLAAPSQNTVSNSPDSVPVSPVPVSPVPVSPVPVMPVPVMPVLSPPLWAMIFPGQGSQYHGMLKSLSDSSPLCREIIASLDDSLQSHGFPTFAELAWNNSSELGKNVFHTQLSLLIGNTVFARMLKKMGVRVSLYFGHSYGEYPALHAAGAWDFVTAAIATQHRCSAIESLRSKPSGMLSTNAEKKYLEQLFCKIHSGQSLGQSFGQLFISNRNTPNQTVVSGELAALKELDAVLRHEKYVSIILPVPAGFHSPLVQEVCEPLRKSLSVLPIRFPDRAFLSGVTERFEAEPASIREALVEQMIRPVDFVTMITKAYQNGIRRFVEAGPRMILSNMGRKILPNEVKSGEVVFLSCDVPKGNGEQILQRFEEIAALYRNDLALPETSKKSKQEQPAALMETAVEPKETARELSSEQQPVVIASCQREETTDDLFRQCDRKGFRTDLVLPTDIVCCDLSGSSYEIGLNMGRLFKQPIRHILRCYADIAGQSYKQLPDVSADLNQIDQMFSSDSLAELKGIAKAAEVPFQSLLRHNLSVYPDSTESNVRGYVLPTNSLGLACTYFAGHARDGVFLQGANIDVPIFRVLSGSHLGILQIRRPNNKIPHLMVTGSGFIGGIFGINAAGLAIAGASISELPRTAQISNGLLPTLLIERILAEAGSLTEALELIRSTPRSASWSLCLTELPTRQMMQVEYSGVYWTVRKNLRLAMAANHQQYLTDVLPTQPPKALSHSKARLNRLQKLLLPADGHFQSESDQVFSVLRDKLDTVRGNTPRHRTINTIWRIDNILSLMVDSDHGLLHLASTDMIHTDSDDPAHRHATVSLYHLLPELSRVLSGNLSKTSKTLRTAPQKIPVTTKEFLNNSTNSTNSTNSPLVIDCEEYARLNTSCNGKEPIPVPMKFNRFVPRLIETALPSQSLQKITGAVLIVSDNENKTGRKLRECLSKQNIRSFLLPPEQTPETIGEELNRMEKECPITHLFFIPSQISETPLCFDPNRLKEYNQTTVLPIFVLKEWLRLVTARNGNFNECAVLASVSLGGDFGLTGQSGSAFSGSLAGLLKGFRMELAAANKSLRIKIIDTESHQEPEQSAKRLFFESEHWDTETEITYKNDRRLTIRSILSPLPEAPVLSLPKEPETWIITGGARGITAAIAHELGKQRHAKLFLIGSSPLPQIDPAWKKMGTEQLQTLRKEVVKKAVAQKEVPSKVWERIEKALEIEKNLDAMLRDQIDFTYHSCDLTDEKAVHTLLTEIMETSGEITGIIYGAGFEAASRIEKKKLENIRRTFDVKVKGAAAFLNELETMGKRPKIFLGFSSVSGRFGGVGQVDYCAANEMLSKLLDWYDAQQTDCRAISVQWPAWGEIGMAARPESKIALAAAGLELMPPHEGIAHLLNEIAGILNNVAKNIDEPSPHEREILISDWNYYKRFYPDALSIPKPPVAQHSEIIGSFLLLGDNSDAEAIQRSFSEQKNSTVSLSEADNPDTLTSALQKFAESATPPTLIVTVPRDPYGAHVSGQKHWQARFERSIQRTLDCCRNWINLSRSAHRQSFRLVILTSLADDVLPYIPEGAFLLNHLEEWITADDKIDVRILDFSADAFPEVVAAATLEECRNEIVPGQCEIVFPQNNKRYDFFQEQWGRKWLAEKKLPAVFQKTKQESFKPFPSASATVLTSPLIDRITNDSEGIITASGMFKPDSDVFLREHLLNGKSILPMVAAMECFAETIRDAFVKKLLPEKKFIGFDGFEIIQGMVCRVRSPYRFKIHCETVPDSPMRYHGLLLGDYYNTKGSLLKDNLRYVKTELCFCDDNHSDHEKTDSGLNFTMVSDYWFDTWYPESGEISIYHGNSLRCMGRMHYLDPFRAIAEFHVPDPAALWGERPQDAVLYAAVIDAVLYACGIVYWSAKKGVCIPVGMNRFRTGSGRLRAGEKGLAHIEMIAESNKTVQFNFTVRNPAGEIVYDVNGYRAVVLRIPQNN
ncbi:MAG: C45 family autoproteolytic acyltransferase/hydrolase, partial [Planctomycetaceae bacterium]|nr:C45 family autoproteolytic acyltransferase/hydrolase [Planctomycetaceae bacterium]